jgi:transcription antitermination factor NusG
MSKTEWFAVNVRTNREITVAQALQYKTCEVFLPLYGLRRTWSDRIVNLQAPLFPGYVFARFDTEDRTALIVTTPGVVRIVSFGGKAVPVEEREISFVRTIVASGLPAQPWLQVQPGLPVRILHGPLAGVEGALVELKKHHQLVVSISLLQRSVAVEINAAWAEPVNVSLPPVQCA